MVAPPILPKALSCFPILMYVDGPEEPLLLLLPRIPRSLALHALPLLLVHLLLLLDDEYVLVVDDRRLPPPFLR